MSQVYQNSDCFLFDIEPNFTALPFQACHRKPSYDDILCELLGSTSTDFLEVPMDDINKSKATKTAKQSSLAKKQKKKRENTKTLVQGQQRGHWKVEENKRYHWFLELHCSHFLNKHLRRMDKIFKSMQKFIATREAEQCRSHHQKMEKKHGSFVNILKELRRQIYGSMDADFIISDMKQNGIECKEQILSWGYLQNESSEVIMQVASEDSQKLTNMQGSPKDSLVVEAIAELNGEYEDGLQLLIL